MDYSTYKLTDLKNLCRERNLKVSGSKQDLTDRLQQHEQQQPTTTTKLPVEPSSLFLPDNQQLEQVTSNLPSLPSIIQSDTEYEQVASALQLVKQLTAEIESTFGPIERAWRSGLNLTTNTKKKHLEPLNNLNTRGRQLMSAWVIEKQRRQEEERKQLEAAQQEAAEAAALERVNELLEAGDVTQAEQLLDDLTGGNVQPASRPIPMVAAKPTADGASVRMLWDFEVVDENKISRRYLKPDLVAIRQAVQRIKDKDKAEAEIGGIRAFQKPNVAIR